MRADHTVIRLLRMILPVEPDEAETGEALAAMIGRSLGRDLSTRRIGEAVAALRAEGVPVVSSSKPPRGYRIGTSLASMEACAREHERRAKQSLRMAAEIRRMSVKDVVEQMGLFT